MLIIIMGYLADTGEQGSADHKYAVVGGWPRELNQMAR